MPEDFLTDEGTSSHRVLHGLDEETIATKVPCTTLEFIEALPSDLKIIDATIETCTTAVLILLSMFLNQLVPARFPEPRHLHSVTVEQVYHNHRFAILYEGLSAENFELHRVHQYNFLLIRIVGETLIHGEVADLMCIA